MQIKEAKDYFELGVITGFTITPRPMGKGYYLGIQGKEGKHWVLETKLGEVKVFASLDTLVGQVRDITGNIRWLSIAV